MKPSLIQVLREFNKTASSGGESSLVYEAFRREFRKVANLGGRALREGAEFIADPIMRRLAQSRQALQGATPTGQGKAILEKLKARAAAGKASPGPVTSTVNKYYATGNEAMLQGSARLMHPPAAQQFFGRKAVSQTAPTQVMKRTVPLAAPTQVMPRQSQLQAQSLAQKATAALQQRGASPGVLARMRQMALGQ